MSNGVVLDWETWIDALTQDTRGVLRALTRECDQIVINQLIHREYNKHPHVSALLPKLEQLRTMRPRPKVIEPPMAPARQISGPIHHRKLFQGAIRARANIIIMSVERRGRWETLARDLEQEHGLRVLTPEKYVEERTRKSPVTPA